MEKPEVRTDAELLQILLDNIGNLRTGLCHLMKILTYDGIINSYEKQRLRLIIDNEIPDYDFYVWSAGFYFQSGLIKPRIKYLKALIIKYS